METLKAFFPPFNDEINTSTHAHTHTHTPSSPDPQPIPIRSQRSEYPHYKEQPNLEAVS